MAETELIEKLAAAVAKQVAPAIPLSVDLWDVATIAAFLKRDPQVVRERITVLPDFPKAIRLPSAPASRAAGTKGRAHPLYKAAEVIAWAEKYQEKR